MGRGQGKYLTLCPRPPPPAPSNVAASESWAPSMEEAAGPNGHPELDRVLSGEPPAVPGRPSMAQDVIKGRATEIEYLNGMVSDKGTEMGIKTPYSNAVVEVLKAVESGEFDIGVDNLDRVASIVRASA